MINKKAGIGAVIIVIILLILLAIAGFFIYSQVTGGVVRQITDPCESPFSQCNHGCGEGILSSICKEKCSYDYRQCKG